MSLFLQTVVVRGIWFSEQQHRQERIGVWMTNLGLAKAGSGGGEKYHAEGGGR
jgi:hypothetical protein